MFTIALLLQIWYKFCGFTGASAGGARPKVTMPGGGGDRGGDGERQLSVGSQQVVNNNMFFERVMDENISKEVSEKGVCYKWMKYCLLKVMSFLVFLLRAVNMFVVVFQRRVRLVMGELNMSNLRAENVVKLAAMTTSASSELNEYVTLADIVDAVRDHGNLKGSKAFLQQECGTCYSEFPARMVSMKQPTSLNPNPSCFSFYC